MSHFVYHLVTSYRNKTNKHNETQILMKQVPKIVQ